MCDCRKTLEEDKDGLIAAFIAKNHKGAAVDRIEYEGVAFPLTRTESGALKLGMVTTSTLKVAVKGKVRPVSVPVMHGFCPFCGVKYGADNQDPEEVMS